MGNNKNDIQELLNITDDIAKRYHLEFGKNKSQIMIINPKDQTPANIKLGEMELDQTKTYKYLGEMLNDSVNIDNQLKEARRKTEAAYQTIIMLTGNKNFKNLEMECIWKLIETCIYPINLYGAETWNLTKAQTKEFYPRQNHQKNTASTTKNTKGATIHGNSTNRYRNYDKKTKNWNECKTQ